MLLLRFIFVFGLVYCDVSHVGYNYPPVQFDETTTVGYVYLPPQIPSLVPTYLPPPPDIFNDDDTIVVQPPTLYGPPGPQVKVQNMSCEVDTKFQSMIHISGRLAGLPPLIAEDGADNCVQHIQGTNNFYIDLTSAKKMQECGVATCEKGKMCVHLRMPTVRHLKLPEDNLVTLQCAPQENVAVHTKHIRLGSNIVSKNGRGRSVNNNIIASGGSQRNFETKISLFRKSLGSDNFNQLVLPGSAVHLGEDLVLRVAVQDGDGWHYSRMGSVLIRSASSPKSINLLDGNGCLIPTMKNVCPNQPSQLSNLVTVLPFRAFLFQGVSKDDVMLLSVNMFGCVKRQDCFQGGFCENPIKSGSRFRRGVIKNETNLINKVMEKDIENWETQFEFRVSSEPESTEENVVKNIFSSEFIVLTSLLSMLVLVIFIVYVGRRVLNLIKK
ncbi:unnamed protein product [Brassicogethes aeneus]|uniref:ZP domain-containing protein n=1 Tax=Brassicogethes aeneus TaxID=1431903 RepID=A0A9P0B8K3_BRAAE|nr:unnamed protein product [Brassicogethes aeneus]